MSIDLTTLIVLIFLIPLIIWSVLLMTEGLGILARAQGEVRTLAGLAAAYTLEVFVTTSVLLGYLLASVGWIPWPSSDSQSLWVLFAVLTMILTLLAPLFFRHWSTPETKRLHGEIRRLALARGALLLALVMLGFLLILASYALLTRPYSFWNEVLNIASLGFTFGAWFLTARGLLQMARVLTRLRDSNPDQARV